MKKPTPRQLRYAYGLMNYHKNRRQLALDAGFSESTARVPKVIESKIGFKLAMAQLAGELENASMRLLFELKARDMSKMSNADLLQCLNVVTKTYDRFSSIAEKQVPFKY